MTCFLSAGGGILLFIFMRPKIEFISNKESAEINEVDILHMCHSFGLKNRK